MKFKQDTDILTADGEKIGQIDRVVVDPRTNEVTHLVIRQGFLFPEDHVISVDEVEQATDDQVTLKSTKKALPDLPLFKGRR